MQQVEIAKVLFRGAEIIIMDEPTSTLTPQGIRGLFKALRELKAAGKTIILITHKLDEIFAISDEITVMRDGKLIGTFLSSESNQQKLANLMVGPRSDPTGTEEAVQAWKGAPEDRSSSGQRQRWRGAR